MLLTNPVIAAIMLVAAPIGTQGATSALSGDTDVLKRRLETRVHASWDNGGAIFFQVQVEQRVIIRVPRQTSTGRRSLSDLQSLPNPSEDHETRKIGDCIAMNSIAGVQITSEDVLMLYLRDRRLIRAELERACHARDFYSGFYLEMSEDGRLCAERDILHSRSGTKCELTRILEIVPNED